MSDPICPKFEYAISLISKKWMGLIIYQLLNGPKRFSELEQEIHVSGRVLSERLKILEQEGLVVRHVYPEVPVRIEYELTKKGCTIEPVMNEIARWGEMWAEKKN